ncbi:MAG: phospholipase D-like domain-containing protein [Gammaproteobacteria bacterium]|jgi:cardiolipin synthase|nr:phospholipase D-like domain-containing protein [Gammaproteobacteria bacterium]
MNLFSWSDQPLWLLLVSLLLAVYAVAHILLSKRDHPAASLGWIMMVILLPLTGVMIYGWLGVNRVERRAKILRSAWNPPREAPRFKGKISSHLYALAELGRHCCHRSLTDNHSIELLHNGEQAYPAMLAAIASAQQQIWLSTYIFDTDRAGHQFIEALAKAQQRKVQIRVLVDGVGELYSWPRVSRLLRQHAIPCARFLPLRIYPFTVYSNLRNHRKMLLIDGELAFFGGMNIGDRHVLAAHKHSARDVHFALRGQLLEQLGQVFARDWRFITDEALELVKSAPQPQSENAASKLLARVIADGPDKDLDRLRMIILGAIRTAEQQLLIMTPYFIPADEIISALKTAALSGVRVDLLLPEHSNIFIADWASRALWSSLLEAGIHIHLQPPPFTHGKWLLVDSEYALLGSANIDERSLRLNYELGVELYNADFVSHLQTQSQAMMQASRELDQQAVEQWSLPTRLRNASAWLAAPYL